MATWSKENVLNFIEEYRCHECLWRVKSKDYSNRIKRDRSYQELVDFVKGFEPQADKDLVIKKISNLRNSFRKQLRKLDTLKDSVLDEIGEPKLWYFHALDFLMDHETPQPSQSEMEPDLIEEQRLTPLDSDSDVPGSPTEFLTPTPSTTRLTSQLQTPNPRSARADGNSHYSRRPPTKRRSSPVEDELLTLARGRFFDVPSALREEDQFETFGKTVGYKLRDLPREQSVHAQKLISDILYEADLGTLSRGTVISRIETYSEQTIKHPIADNDV